MNKKYWVIFLLAAVSFTQTCHYSCSACSQQFYNYCINCTDPYSFTVVYDPTQINNAASQMTGICIGKVEDNVNVFGILLVAFSILGLAISRGSKVFYIVYTLQTFALLSYIQIGWVSPLSYVLNGLQYLMIFNIMGVNLKETSTQFTELSFYRLDQYYKESSIIKSMAILGIFNCFVILMIIIIPIFKLLRKKYCSDACRFMLCANWFLQTSQKFLYVAFFLMIQETILSIVVSFYFAQTITAASIAIATVYGCALIFFFVCTYIRSIKLFENRLIQCQNILKKIIFPVFLIIQQPYQYVLLIFLLVNLIFQLLFDFQCDVYPLKSKMTIFKTLQATIIILAGIYYIVETVVNESQSVLIISYFLLVFLCLDVVALLIESVLATKKRYCEPKGKVAAVPVAVDTLGQKTVQTITNTNSKKTLPDFVQNFQNTQDNILQSEEKEESEKKSEKKEEKIIEEDLELNQNVLQLSQKKKLNSLKRKPRRKNEQDKTDYRKELEKRYGF